MDRLLEPHELRHLTIRNRIISTAYAPNFVENGHPRDRREKWGDHPDIIATLRAEGLAGLNPLLDEDLHGELVTSRDAGRIVEIILGALGRVSPAYMHGRRREGLIVTTPGRG